MSKAPSSLLQSSTLPPAQPDYILRGHTAQIHCVHFLRQNLRLLTGDADGWVILWNLAIKRPVAVWKAHGGSVLGVGIWGLEEENIITYVCPSSGRCCRVNADFSIRHGRDNKLYVWQLRGSGEAEFSTILPIEDTTSARKQPWLLHSLDVNALNFCSFAMCQMPTLPSPAEPASSPSPQHPPQSTILIAVPGVQDGLINITALPSQTRYATIPPPKDTSTGMLMAVSLLHQPNNTASPILVAAGYESGHVALWHRKPDPTTKEDKWQTFYLAKPHSQPVLSLDIAPNLGFFFSSSADAIVARHPLDGSSETRSLQTKHAGQQSLVVRADGKIFATAGWDGRVRVYAAKGMKELAVLKWHKEGCYAAAFAEVLDGGAVDVDDSKDSTGRGQALTVSQQRLARSKATHWLAAGSKDGRVSLWDIY
jgi:WD40 repeat protein